MNDSDYDFLKKLAYELAYKNLGTADAARLRNIASVHREALKQTKTLTQRPLIVRVSPNSE